MTEIDIRVKTTSDLSGITAVETETARVVNSVETKWHSSKPIPMPKVEAFAEIDKYKTPIDNMATSLNTLGDAGTHAGGDGAGTGLSWAAVAVGNFVGNLASNVLSQLPQIAADLYKAGDAASRTATGFEALGGKDSDLGALKTAAGGLVSDTNLMASASMVMKANFSTSVGSVQEIVEKGGTLGEAFEGSATEGPRS